MGRKGSWEYSLPFSLGRYYGTPKQSDRFSLERVSVTPVIAQFDVDGADPSGSRHLTNHASFLRILASGTGAASPLFDDYDFNDIDISEGSGISDTRCIVLRLNHLDCPNNSRIYNMKMWISNTADFLTDDWKVIYTPSGSWNQGYDIPVRYFADQEKWLSDSMPSTQNVYRQDGGLTIYGSGDADVSQYLYMAVASSGTLPLGEYGGSTSGFYVRITYDLDNIDVLRD